MSRASGVPDTPQRNMNNILGLLREMPVKVSRCGHIKRKYQGVFLDCV